MKAIDNSGLLNLCHSCGADGFQPGVSYSLNTGTKVLTVTDTSVYPAGDGRNVVNVTVTDRFGNSKTAQIKDSATNVTIDLSTGFNTSLGFNIQATIVSDKRLIADLSAYDVASSIGATTGTLGYADVETDEETE